MIYEKRCTQFVPIKWWMALPSWPMESKQVQIRKKSMKRVVEIMGNPISQEFSQVLYQSK